MQKEDCYSLGYITKLHGTRGEVAALFDVDYPEEYSELESVFVEINNKLVPFFIESIDVKPNTVLIKFEDVDNPDQAEQIKGKELYLPLSVLPKLEGTKFYYHEVIGFTVLDEERGPLGPIETFYIQGNQDLVALQFQGTEVLFPLIDEFVLEVDRENKLFKVKLPEGLIDLYLEQTKEENQEAENED